MLFQRWYLFTVAVFVWFRSVICGAEGELDYFEQFVLNLMWSVSRKGFRLVKAVVI